MKPISVLFASLLILSNDPALGCKMGGKIAEPRSVKEHARLLFRGRLLRILAADGDEVTPEAVRRDWSHRVLEFEALEVWKGEASPHDRVKVEIQTGGNCRSS